MRQLCNAQQAAIWHTSRSGACTQAAGVPGDCPAQQVSCRGEEGSSGIVRAFFGPDGKHNLDLAKFALFLTALHDEVVRLEFCHYAKSNEVQPMAPMRLASWIVITHSAGLACGSLYELIMGTLSMRLACRCGSVRVCTHASAVWPCSESHAEGVSPR